MNPITVFLVIACALVGLALGKTVDILLAPPFLVAAVIIALSLKMANTWQKFVILRAGKLHGVKGPGLFLIFPIIDNVAAVIDERIQTTAFNAEQALTKDTVPVNVDAIIFWHVHDARKAALEITDYRQAIDRVAQTSLREMIGSSMLAALLSDRKAADEHLRDEIGNKTAGWGVVSNLGRDPRRRHPGGPAGRHVSPGPGGAGKTGPRHSRVGRSRDRREVCRGRPDLCRSSCRTAAACHEHHLRDDKGTRHHDPDPDVDGRQYEPCLGSGARRPKGSRRGYPVAEERRLRTFLGGLTADERRRPDRRPPVIGMHND